MKGGEGGVAALQLESVSGVFVVTILGCFIAAVFAVIEFLVGTRQSAKVQTGWPIIHLNGRPIGIGS